MVTSNAKLIFITMEKEIVYGVVDKNSSCDSYVGFFKKEEDAIKELQNQIKYMAFDYGIKDLKVVGDKVIKTENGKEVILYAVHRYVLR
jgi:hypothetical protein